MYFMWLYGEKFSNGELKVGYLALGIIEAVLETILYYYLLFLCFEFILQYR